MQQLSWRDLGFDGFMTRAIPYGDALSIGSVKNNQVYGGAITNPKISPQYRAYKAVVSPVPGEGGYPTIQEAIDYVNSLETGGKILIKKGTFTPGADLTTYTNINLIGEDSVATIIDFESGDYGIVATGSSGSELTNIGVENLTIKDSNKTTGATGSIHFTFVDDSSIEKVHFDSCQGDADIKFTTCDRSDIIRCYSNSTSKGFYLLAGGDATTACRVLYCYLDNSTIGQINADNEALIFGNRINGTVSTAAISTYNHSIIANNHLILTGGSKGIYLVGIGCTVTGNYIEGNDAVDYGIYALYGSGRNVVQGNKIEDMATDGIYFAEGGGNGVIYSSVIGNIVQSSAHAMTIAGANSIKNTVVGNQFIDGYTDSGTNTDSGHNIIA